MNALAQIKNYFSGISRLLAEIDVSAYDTLVRELARTREEGRQIFIMGNGGSASTASHFVCDMNKGCSYGREKRFRVLCLNDSAATVLAYANDVSYDEVFVEQLKNFAQPGDLVIGISGSGNSKNVVKAIEYGNQLGAVTFCLTGFKGGKLKGVSKHNLVVPSEDMQKIEDAHILVLHCVMQYFSTECGCG